MESPNFLLGGGNYTFFTLNYIIFYTLPSELSKPLINPHPPQIKNFVTLNPLSSIMLLSPIELSIKRLIYLFTVCFGEMINWSFNI